MKGVIESLPRIKLRGSPRGPRGPRITAVPDPGRRLKNRCRLALPALGDYDTKRAPTAGLPAAAVRLLLLSIAGPAPTEPASTIPGGPKLGG